MQTEIKVVDYHIHEVVDYINWIYFFHTWGFSLKFASIADIHDCDACRIIWATRFSENERAKANEAAQLYKEAVHMLNQLDGTYMVHAIYKLMDAYSDGDDLLADGIRIPLLRQQNETKGDQPFLCLSDFVRPLHYGIADTIGGFATSVDEEMEQLYSDDAYKQMLVKTLCERLAEAAAEKLHESIRKSVWGYAKDEKLSIKDLLVENYQGIRPAVGYPSLPDLSINFLLNELIDMKRIGIRLTENAMMRPTASVCGFMFAHPAAHYFSVGKIDEIQLKDYARRRGMHIDLVRKFLRANL